MSVPASQQAFVLGRNYLARKARCGSASAGPSGATVIANLHDPSALLQPTATWSLAQTADLLVLGSLNLGGTDTEFGGYDLETRQTIAPADSLACRLTWHF